MKKKRTYNKSSTKNYNEPTSNRLIDRMKMNPMLNWLSDMIQITSKDEIKIPTEYRDQVLEVKKLLTSDVSGMVNTVTDFGINSALVDFSVVTENDNLTKKLNIWLENINSSMRGTVPVGTKALAKEYYRERWKGSSFLLLRTFWEEIDGLTLPTVLYFLDGEDIVVESKSKAVNLNEKTYYLRIGDDKKDWKKLPAKENEKLFIQRPYSSWGVDYPVPYLLQKGIYKNLKFLQLLEEKGEFVVSKAIELITLFKKGTEGLTLSGKPDLIYGKEDLQQVEKDYTEFVQRRKGSSGLSSYITGFDTEISHIIPDYIKALDQSLYSPIERRIIAGLGLVEVVEGISTTRKDAILNPKPFFAEIKTGVEDFKALLFDIINVIIEKNKPGHRKYFKKNIKVRSTLIKENLNDRILTQLRSIYDRGLFSKRSYLEVFGADLDIESDRRIEEEDLEEIMYPPVIQNIEKDVDPTKVQNKEKQDKISEDKKSVEKVNYNKSQDSDKTTQEAKIDSLPDGVRAVFTKAYTNALKTCDGDQIKAWKTAWNAMKIVYKKVGDKWVKKSQGELEEGFRELDISQLIELKKLEFLGKKNKILDKILEVEGQKETE